ncbi:hypothetical protein [Natronococcus roseus]|uniref:hypothetical protein n=1 Tax=Natronococcus roseus TaxID=1052014 RepID=UPI00374DCD03
MSEETESELTHTTILISEEQQEWLRESEINLSALVRDIIDDARVREEVDSASILEGVFVDRERYRERAEKIEEVNKELREDLVEALRDSSENRGDGDAD